MLALGGGGSPAPLPELVLEWLAAAIAIVWVVARWQGPAPVNVPRAAWLIAGLIALLPLLQLIPLPPPIWHSLPSREVERQALALIGAESSWRTWSLAPSRTLSSLLSLGPPLLLLVMTSALARGGRLLLIRCIALMAVATLVLGALQLSSGDASAVHLYGVAVPMLVGFQANHNSTADVLLVAMVAVPVMLRELVDRRVIPDRPLVILSIAAAALALIGFGVVLTASRMGIFLLPIPLLASLWMLRPWLHLAPRTIALGVAGSAIAGVILTMIARSNPVLATIAARFDFSGELRPQLWRDGFYVAQRFFPFGVGMGDFVPALVADERLEAIYPALPNRAHNDFLELAVETGIVGLAALSAISLTLGRALWRKLRGPAGQSQTLAVFAASGLAVLALHSLVDYPFRSMALASLGAVCAGLLLTPRLDGGPAGDAPGLGKTR